jgi:NAD(P)-dependent dehydrogenase (short-subunit alcohol dehydrogenase family)
MPPTANRTVLISGASKGIGEACALHLDRLGFKVFAGYRSEADGAALAFKSSERLTPIPLDVTDDASVTAAARAVAVATGEKGLWGLVNNAGIVVPGPIEVLPLEELRRQLEVNLFGVLRLTQALMPSVRQATGRLVNISSVNGRVASPFAGAYAASKFALEALSDAFRIELARWNVQVVVVQPGAIQTPIWETTRERAIRMFDGLSPTAKQLYGRVIERISEFGTPKRALPPQRVANVVARALTVRRPRTRYRVGWDSRVGVILSHVLPDRTLDRLLGARRSLSRG